MSAECTARLVTVFLLGLTLGCFGGRVESTPFTQPAKGPGGAEYSHASITESVYHEETVEEFWLFEPASPTPATAPLIVFNHGWGAMQPNAYGAWIQHLVRRGNIVVYPRYQTSMRTSMDEFTPNAIRAVKAALAELVQGNHVRPQLNHFAIVGHSVGGAITPNMAALASSEGLPAPKAIMCVAPGSYVVGRPDIAMPFAELTHIPSTTLVLIVVGDQDTLVGDKDAKRILSELKQIPDSNKDFVTVVSDAHGRPELVADHNSSTAFAEVSPKSRRTGGRLRERIKDRQGIGRVDALDYYGYWKLFDALTDAAFYGKNRVYALGDTPQQRYMGRWPDGTPVRELIVRRAP